MFNRIRVNYYIMPKKGSNPTGIIVLTVLLILSIGGFGYWNYTLQVNQVKTYYADHDASFTSDAEDAFYAIPELTITIDVGRGDKVYVMFTCTASLTAVSSITQMHFLVKIDTTQILESMVTVGYTGTITVTAILYSVALQYIDDSLTSGSHTVTIMTERECDGYIVNSELLIQVQ